jgi:glucokinase
VNLGGALGFDVGGQSIKAVRVDADGEVLAEVRLATGPETDVEALVTRLRQGSAALEGGTPLPCGIGIAGVLDRSGRLGGSPNLPRLAGVDLARLLEGGLGRRVVVDNDANCAALAEIWGGAAANLADVLFVALGTGLGSGLVLGGEIFHGATGHGCELGHMIIEREGRLCGCGNRGCLEAYVSEVAVRARVREAGGTLLDRVERGAAEEGRGWSRALFALAGLARPARGTGPEPGVETAAALAREMVRDIARTLGIGLASAVNVFDVPVLVLGGGMAEGLLGFREDFDGGLADALFARRLEDVRVLPAARGSLAGAIGAARLGMLEAARS